jgi:hypothetical protein
MMEEQKAWATPQQRDFIAGEPLAKWTERAEEQKAKGVNLHLPLPSQVMHMEEKSWATPNTLDHMALRSPEALLQQATTTRAGRTAPANLREQVDPASVEIYQTKTAPEKQKITHKLNPRWVETLMGLPVGWVMPSCTSLVTIAQTNFDSSETELFQQQQNSPLELSGQNLIKPISE